jgi:amphiphysin
MDYFQRGAAQKKKPPPPPPKRIGSQNSSLYAVALYAFEGQSAGDLSFREGDQIKVVKKTDSTDDWWEGELRGVKGSFPANYCKLA